MHDEGSEAGLVCLGARGGAALGAGIGGHDLDLGVTLTLTCVTHGLTLCRHVTAPGGAGSLNTVRPSLHPEIVSSGIHTGVSRCVPRHPLGHGIAAVTLSGASIAGPQPGKMSISASSDIIANHSLRLPLLLVVFDEANVRGGSTEERPRRPDTVQRVTASLLLHVFQSRLECAYNPELWK